MKNKKLIIDMVLNIFASVIPIVFLQLFALPYINNIINNPTNYGVILTIISLLTMTSRTYGNTLNNVRLILNSEYEEEGKEGDFNILLYIGTVVITFIVILISIKYYNYEVDSITLILISLISITLVLREYVIVAFRLELDYKGILLNNLVLVIGYSLGLILFSFTGYWQFIYIIGQTFSILYVLRCSGILKEKLAITDRFRSTTYKTLLLTVTTMLSTVTSYADKLLLLPLLGAATVSVYYTSTLLGKIISLMVSPISGVILSYLSKRKNLKASTFMMILITSIAISIVGYFIAIFVSGPILRVLYPDYYAGTIKLIPITTASAMITLVIAMINPVVMRFKNINWQVYINIQHLIVYIISAFLLTNKFGVIGFTISILITLIVKIITLILIYYLSKDIYGE